MKFKECSLCLSDDIRTFLGKIFFFGVVCGGFRYIKKPNWSLYNRDMNNIKKTPKKNILPRNVLLSSDKQREHSLNFNDDHSNSDSVTGKNDDSNEKNNIDTIESKKVFQKLLRDQSLSPSKIRKPHSDDFLRNSVNQLLPNLVHLTPKRIVELDENHSINDNTISRQENISTDSIEVFSSPSLSVQVQGVPPKTPGRSPFNPNTPGRSPFNPNTPGRSPSTPSTPGRSPFAQSLAIGSLSPRSLKSPTKTPNSKRFSNTSNNGNDDQYLLKSPLSKIRISPQIGSRKKGINNRNEISKKNQRNINSNEMITDSIFNALFHIEQKNGKNGNENGNAVIHRIRAWDDDSDSEEEEEDFVFYFLFFIFIFYFFFSIFYSLFFILYSLFFILYSLFFNLLYYSLL